MVWQRVSPRPPDPGAPSSALKVPLKREAQSSSAAGRGESFPDIPAPMFRLAVQRRDHDRLCVRFDGGGDKVIRHTADADVERAHAPARETQLENPQCHDMNVIADYPQNDPVAGRICQSGQISSPST